MDQKLIKLRFREDTADNWAIVNPVLDSAEPGYELDTGFYKIGDGETSWNNLSYANKPTITGSNNLNCVTECPDNNKLYVRTRDEDTDFGRWTELPQVDINPLTQEISRLKELNAMYEWRLNLLEANVILDEPIQLKDKFDLETFITRGGKAVLNNSISYSDPIEINKSIIIDLNGNNLNSTYDDFTTACPTQIVNGTVVIKGEGNINSKHYFVNVNNEKAKLVIKSGNFTSDSASVIQVQKGVCEIYGGTFRIADTIGNEYGYNYTLNAIDTNRDDCKIIVYGGSFYKFNPAVDNSDEIKVADGYRVVQDGDWYRVVIE